MRKILTILLMTIIAFILFAGIVLAETGTVTVPELNFRESASTSSDTLGVLTNGTKVNIISEQGDWYKVRYNNKEGYVSKQYVRKDTPTNTTTQENTANTQNNTTNEPTTQITTMAPTSEPSNPTTNIPTDISELNKTNIKEQTDMYVLPLLNSTKLGTINTGAQVLLISVNGDWSYIQTETHNAWVPSKKLESTKITLASNVGKNENNVTPTPEAPTETPTPEPTSTQTPEPTSTKAPEPTDTPTPTPTSTPTNNNSYPTTMYVNVEAVNVRKEPNTNSTIVTSAGKNVPVRVTAKEGDWYKVETSDGNGYIKGEYLSKNR